MVGPDPIIGCDFHAGMPHTSHPESINPLLRNPFVVLSHIQKDLDHVPILYFLSISCGTDESIT